MMNQAGLEGWSVKRGMPKSKLPEDPEARDRQVTSGRDRARTGCAASGCLRATVVEGVSYRFRMIVAEECAFDRHETTHAINLFDMHQKYADVLPLSDVVAYLRSLHPREDSAPVPEERVLVEAARI